MRFVDLFCGIGGFHHALSQLGHECVFACDIDEECRKVYHENWDMTAFDDVRTWSDEIDDHEILCAGFPCQPFSKSGNQLGFEDKIRGTLFAEISKIIQLKSPKYVLLENVANLRTHNNGNTMKTIRSILQNLGYHVRDRVLSPHDFGIPHHRPRIFIVAINKEKVQNYSKFRFPRVSKKKAEGTHVDTIFDASSEGVISESLQMILNHWTKFMKNLSKKHKPPSPTWSMEFGRSYDLENIHPVVNLTKRRLCEELTKEGIKTKMSWTKERILQQYPPYIRKMKTVLPKWKKQFIEKNRQFWVDHKKKIGIEWLVETRLLNETYQKFEWHVGSEKSRDVMDYMIHTRPSGIRVSRLNRIPALVAIAQIPIIGPWGRRISPREAANAQSFSSDFKPHDKAAIAFRQLGNSVNVVVIEEVVKRLMVLENIQSSDEILIPQVKHENYSE